ncbi:MAG: hypothetical protein HOO96_10570 [Polyangiaceae bacterium]|nr:hypothetical protein [Polyangiaceae bacterium]
MPARVLVFCKKPTSHLTPTMLEAELRAADLMTLAEGLELPEGEEAAVATMWTHFRIDADDASIHGVEIRWDGVQRPIQVSAAPPLEGELEETLENLPESDAPGAARVREHVGATVEIVDFEMGIGGSNHLAATIAEVLAFYVAEQADGIVWFYNDEFAAPDDRGATLLSTDG